MEKFIDDELFNERYSSFIPMHEPKKFSEWQANKEIELVQVHSFLCGFCGAFSWKNNQLTPIDHDTYNPNMVVHAYEWFTLSDGTIGLDIIVGNDW